MKLGFGIHWQLQVLRSVGEKIFASSELEKRPKCQEQLKAKPRQARASIVVIKVLMTGFDVTRK